MKSQTLVTFFLILSLLPVLAGGKKPEANVISFHEQGTAEEGPKMVFPVPVKGRQVYFRKSPAISSKDVIAYRPFASATGNGVTLQLNPVASRRLNAITAQSQSHWLLAMVNGRPVDAVIINAPVEDGMLVIWEGIHLVEIQRMTFQWPLIGEDSKSWKNRIKELKKQKKK